MSFERRPLIAGNWKMNGLLNSVHSLAGVLVEKLDKRKASHFDMLICPPATLLSQIADLVDKSDLLLGGQDCHIAKNGAYTGDISAEMLRELGCSYLILGHSERRAGYDETNELVKSKTEAALHQNLTAIICVGETEAERKKGLAFEVVRSQILGSIPERTSASDIVIAYEPVWAIGTGLTPSTKEVQDVHALIRKTLADKIGEEGANRVRILYGGSVKPSNATELMGLADVDGALVGGASLSSSDFWAIAESCPK
jgi:triosephosphate isomerase (TIM)